MAHTSKTPSKSLTPARLKVKLSREQFEQFNLKLGNLVEQLNNSSTESEEHHKNHISDFLKYAFQFPSHFINTKYKNDLVIRNGKSSTDPVGVIIEVKRPANKAEMPTVDNLNVKAMRELVLYYLRERMAIMVNLAVKHLIITNGYEWFIFDVKVFERAFVQNGGLVKLFNDFEAKRLADTTTDFFYKQIAKPAINEMGDIEFTYFDLREKRSEKETVALLKLLSPEHLLKQDFVNDSNSLNKDFYSELLHIIGLIEVKDGSKKLIQRKKDGERNRASLLENAISKIDALDKLRNFENPKVYGDTPQEQLFNVGLELAITWVNRVLFLKLLEAQLISYHKEDKSYAFLNIQRIRSFDDLDGLFFEVLARKPAAREAEIQKTFAKVPYLNSSLFETTEIERKVLNIGNLSGEITLPIFNSTVLKDGNGKRRTGELNTLEYLFAFLEAYDFASEGTDELKDDNKLAYITPNSFLFNVYAQGYRAEMLKRWDIEEILDCTEFDIFADATVRNAVFRLSNNVADGSVSYRETQNIYSFQELIGRPSLRVERSTVALNNQNWGLIFKLPVDVLEMVGKIKSTCVSLANYFPRTSQGLIAYDKHTGQSDEIIKERIFHTLTKRDENDKPWLYGEDVTRYGVRWNGREYVNYCDGIANPRDPIFFRGERILVREITSPVIYAGYTNEELYNDPSVIVVLKNEASALSLFTLLGILNSRFATFFHFNSSPKATKGAFPKILVYDINNFPLPRKLVGETANTIHSKVNQILAIKERNPSADTAVLENEIDQLVYALYDLTPKEIAIVEGKAAQGTSVSEVLDGECA